MSSNIMPLGGRIASSNYQVMVGQGQGDGDHSKNPFLVALGERVRQLRARKGMTFAESRRRMRTRNYYGSVMVERGDAA